MMVLNDTWVSLDSLFLPVRNWACFVSPGTAVCENSVLSAYGCACPRVRARVCISCSNVCSHAHGEYLSAQMRLCCCIGVMYASLTRHDQIWVMMGRAYSKMPSTTWSQYVTNAKINAASKALKWHIGSHVCCIWHVAGMLRVQPLNKYISTSLVSVWLPQHNGEGSVWAELLWAV